MCLPALLTSFTKGGPPSFKFYVFSPDAAEEGRRRASLSGTVPEAHPSRKRLGLASSSWRRTEPSSFFVLDPRIAQLDSLVSLYVRDEASRTPLKPWEKARWWWSESKERPLYSSSHIGIHPLYSRGKIFQRSAAMRSYIVNSWFYRRTDLSTLCDEVKKSLGSMTGS